MGEAGHTRVVAPQWAGTAAFRNIVGTAVTTPVSLRQALAAGTAATGPRDIVPFTPDELGMQRAQDRALHAEVPQSSIFFRRVFPQRPLQTPPHPPYRIP